MILCSECPNGHPYFVGEVRVKFYIVIKHVQHLFLCTLQCGRPVMQATCHICGSAIGGVNHTPLANNVTAGKYVIMQSPPVSLS